MTSYALSFGSGAHAPLLSDAPAPASTAAGFLTARNEGTTGDFYVDASTGSDANPGTLAQPFASIAAAIAAATGGETIRLRGGTYREAVDFSGRGGSTGAPTELARYGSEEVIISAADTLTGWSQCTSADEATVGANYASIHKVTLPTAQIASGDPRAAFLYEDGTRLLPVMVRRFNPQYPQNESITADWLEADQVVLNGSNEVQGYRLPGMTSAYTKAQIENADIAFHVHPNVNRRSQVALFDAATDTIEPADQTGVYETNSHRNQFALLNLLPAMAEGEWGFVESGGTTTLYVWPRNPANLAGGIEYSARGSIISTGSESHVRIRGLILERASSAGATADGLYAFNAGGVTKRAGIEIENCMLRDTYRAHRDYAPIWIGNVDDWRVTQVTVQNAFGQFGVFCAGQLWNSGNGMASGGWLDRCVVEGAENSPFRFFGQTNGMCTRSRARKCGLTAHANKSNAYESCHRFMWWGVDFTGCNGYLTWQEASSIVVGFCNIPVSYEGDGRAIVDQNGATASPATGQDIDGRSYLFNSLLGPFGASLGNSNALTLGVASETRVDYDVRNMILHGASGVDMGHVARWRNNVLTSGTALDASDTVTTEAAVFTDAAAGDLSIRGVSPSHSATADSLSDVIATLQGWFPNFDGFGEDINGTPFSASAPPVGPIADQGALPDVPAQWITRPQLSGTPTVGNTLSVAGGALAAAPFASPAWQWVRSSDGVTWIDVPGATSTAFTLTNAHIGDYIGARASAGGAETIAAVDAAVADSFPLGPLQEMTVFANSTTNSSDYESASFAATGTPLLVVVSTRNSANADNALTVTVGTPGRSAGGEALNQVAQARRSVNESQVFMLIAPTAGTATIQVSAAGLCHSCQIAVYELPGLTGVGATADSGATNTTSATTSVTTTATDSLVLHVFNRFDGDVAGNPMLITGATELLNAGTGTVDQYQDLVIGLAYEEAAATGSYDASASWPTARVNARLSVELLS